MFRGTCFAVDSGITEGTKTLILIHLIYTRGTVIAWVAGTFIYICFHMNSISYI